ncbi:MAG: imidazole glycerol phosphate synthase subunit HisH [Planctomycetota bacterium]
MSPDVTIVDYGMGNLRSVARACERVGMRPTVTADPAVVATASKLVLPGVGAFRDAIAALRSSGLDGPVCRHVGDDKPFLGICLGLQLLFDRGYEDGEHEGLGLIAGEVVRFGDEVPGKVPHMGWNTLRRAKPSRLLGGLGDDASVYFVHSYYVVPDDADVVATTTEYGPAFVSMVERGNLFATQFHPEKSQRDGLRILENFAAL